MVAKYKAVDLLKVAALSILLLLVVLRIPGGSEGKVNLLAGGNVRWTCQPVEVVVGSLGERDRDLVENALVKASKVSGIDFVAVDTSGQARRVDVVAVGEGSSKLLDGTVATWNSTPSNGKWTYGMLAINKDISGLYSDEDLQAVFLHEFGHMLGLAHSDNPSDLMHASSTKATGFSADEKQAIKTLYASCR